MIGIFFFVQSIHKNVNDLSINIYIKVIMMVNNITKYDKELQDIIDNFFDGKLDKNKRKENKKSNIIVVTHNNINTFPPTNAPVLLPSAGAFYLQFNDLKGRLF